MSFRGFITALGKLFLNALVAVLAWLAIVNSPLIPRRASASPANAQAHHKTDEPSKDKHATPETHGGKKGKDPLAPNPLEHVMDSEHEWELFMTFEPKHIELPYLGYWGKPWTSTGDVYLSKYVILMMISALIICLIYIPLAARMRDGGVPRGIFGNFFEVFLTFIRDQIAKPSIGEHDADKFVPFLWTMFLFILVNNLLGMVPFGGSATASIYVTGALALIVFGYMHGSGASKMGFGHYVLSLWPHMDVPFVMGLFIKPMIFVLEWVGVLVRNGVLAVRLFANMFAGHTVLAVLLIFILVARDDGTAAKIALWSGITVSSVLGIIALSLLELFVAFLQAYIFTFLTALFMGMALHPEH
jgi:F-type H+-transporting ATPase subunit a